MDLFSDIQQAESNRLIGDMVAAFKTIFDSKTNRRSK